MTRPMVLGRTRPLLSYQLGSELPNSFSSNSANPPTDWGEGLPVFIPGSAVVEIVQSATNHTGAGGGANTVTLGSPPTAGNILVAGFAQRAANGGTMPTPTGWTAHPSGQANDSGGAGDSFALFYKVSDGAETGVTYAGIGSGANAGVIVEVGGADTLDTFAETNAGTTSSTTTTGSVTPTAGASVFVIGGVAIRGADTLETGSPNAGWTELADLMAQGTSLHPHMWVGYQIVASASGSYNPSVNVAAGNPYAGQTLVFSEQGVPTSTGDAATDGDLATYAGPATDFYLQLGEAREIVRTVAQLAWENSGSRTVTIYGATQADFSDEVQLDQWSVSATGSWSIDATSASWAAAGEFRYYHLTVSTTARLHEWELYEASPGSALDDHLSDTTDAHDASAISIADAGGYFTGTDVEAALQELGAAGGGSGITVADEGSNLSTAATTLDFVGAGVTATGTGATKTITIPGGSGSAPGWVADLVGTTATNDYYWDGNDLAGFTTVTVTGSTTWAEDNNVVSVKASGMTSEDANCVLVAKTFSVGDTWQVPILSVLGHATSGAIRVGIIFTDGTTSAANAVGAHLQTDANPRFVGRHGTLTSLNTAPWVLDGNAVLGLFNPHIRLIYQAANTFRVQFGDGVSFSTFGEADISKTMTPTHVGLFVMQIDADEVIATFGPLRKVA